MLGFAYLCMHDTFHFWYVSLPLVAYERQSAVLTLLLSFSGMHAMLTLFLTNVCKIKLYLYILSESPCTCCGSFRKDPPIVVCHFSQINHDTFPGFLLWNLRRLFLHVCSQHLYVFQCQIAVKFFLMWKWRLIKSLPTIHVFTWINTFPRHQTKFVRICRCFWITCLNLHQNLFHSFSCSLYVWISMSLFDCLIFKIRLVVFVFAFVESFGKIISQTW